MPFEPTPQPCWLILQEGDWLGCGTCWGKAVRLAELIWAEEIEMGARHEGPPVIQRADSYCIRVRCSGCGAWHAGEYGAPSHSASMVEAIQNAAEDGWLGDVCPACQASDLMP